MSSPERNTPGARISLLVPAYNEAEVLPYFEEEFNEFLKRVERRDVEVIFVDDGSTDDTWQVIQGIVKRNPWAKAARHSKNLGKTRALETAASLAEGEALVIFDADLQYTFEDALALADKLLEEGWDIVAGYKVGKYQKPFVSKVYNWLSAKLFGLRVRDLNAMKAIRASVFRGLWFREDWHRYIIPLAVEKGHTVTEMAVKLRPRRAGKSKYTGLWRVVVGVADLLAVKFQLTVMRKPLLYLGTAGAISLGLAALVSAVALWLRFGAGHGYRPLLYLVILLGLAGLILISMGFLGEMVAGVIDMLEAQRRWRK